MKNPKWISEPPINPFGTDKSSQSEDELAEDVGATSSTRITPEYDAELPADAPSCTLPINSNEKLALTISILEMYRPQQRTYPGSNPGVITFRETFPPQSHAHKYVTLSFTPRHHNAQNIIRRQRPALPRRPLGTKRPRNHRSNH